MKRKIKINWAEPEIGKEEKKLVNDCFNLNRFTQGKKVSLFEKNISKFVGSKYAVAVSNGTVALDLAYKAINLRPGDEVIMPAITYISTAMAVSYQGGIPVFVDVDLKNNCIKASEISKAITKKTKAISFIDYGGYPSNYNEILKISKKKKIHIIWEAAQKLGGKYLGKTLGAGGLISTMSFHLAKIITTVEGGVIFTNSKKLYEDLLIRRNIGEPKNQKYQHTILGTNARMTDLQAGIGIAQLKKLKNIVIARNSIAKKYDKLFKNENKIKLFDYDKRNVNSYFFYPILINNRDSVAKKLLKKYGIDTRIAYPKPVFEQPIYKNKVCKSRHLNCPNAKNISKKIINLPIFPKMTNKQIRYTVSSIKSLINTKFD